MDERQLKVLLREIIRLLKKNDIITAEQRIKEQRLSQSEEALIFEYLKNPHILKKYGIRWLKPKSERDRKSRVDESDNSEFLKLVGILQNKIVRLKY